MTEYEFHEIAELFPMLSEEELQAQSDDIKENGLIHPIVLFEDKILDGRNRYVACGMADVAPRFEVFNGSFADAITRVWSENIHRRDLTSSQRAMIGISRNDLVDRIEQEAKNRQGNRNDIITTDNNVANIPIMLSECIESREVIAKISDTSPSYVSDAKRIKHESPEVADMVKTGSISIPEAKKIIKLEPETQTKVIHTIKASPTISTSKTIHEVAMTKIKEDIAAQTADDPNKPHIDHNSYAEWLPQQPICDLLLTDPPYTTDVDDIDVFANDWLPMALSKVKATGRAYVFIGAYPDEIAAYLAASNNSDMVLANILVWTYRNTLGPSPTHDYHLKITSFVIIIYT